MAVGILPQDCYQASVRTRLEYLGYPHVAREAALAWLAARGTVDGCPAVAPSDWQPVNDAFTAALYEHATRETERPAGELEEGDPATWPRWTDAWRWAVSPGADEEVARLDAAEAAAVDPGEAPRHSPDDESWWAAASPANAAGFVVVRRPSAPRPLRLTGRRAGGPAEAVSCWTDADQALHGCV